MRVLFAGLTTVTLFTTAAHSASDYHRLIWDTNPSNQATLGYTPTGGNNHYVKYGTTTDEQSWTTQQPTAKYVFDGSLESEFVTLTGLSADTAIYYRVCDSTGCGQRMWFKTAPATSTGFVAIAGGDTRTGWTTRREGNALVAKIRPLFIMHGGDYTNANSAQEMREYLKDWQLTLSDDVIDGQSYKRIYPFVATFGNHEGDNFKTLCQVFGVDYDKDGACTNKDSYGAFNIANLLRVYTLNSQYKDSGWSSYATAMNNWLKQDLQSNGAGANWRIAQYHKPMYPHYSGKSDNTILHTWWADLFYQHGMNLVVESDTHINKLTEALQPSGSGFTKTTTGGTVYVGEGSWGAPARSANDPKSWTIDLASIQQFKVLSVTPDSMKVQTAQFTAGADTLTREQRAVDPLALPANISWWYASELGETMTLKRAANSLSIIDRDSGPVDPGNELQNGQPVGTFAGAADSEKVFTMVVPQGASNLRFTMSGGSGDADLYVRFAQKPTTKNYDCRPYKEGNNESCTITNVEAGTYYIVIRGYSAFSGVSLVGQYDMGTPPGDDNKQTWTDLTATEGNWIHKTFEVPASATKLTVSTAGGTGDADLYVRFGAQPTSSRYDCRPYEDGNAETCTQTQPQTGTWHISVKAYKDFSGVTLTAEY
ncbi:pre-peptidase C-terminal domain-containing protein [Pseudoalteromonas sp. DL2-H2.2]|uniref:pre-peptidase C-terminal domain-containing protein n=1 Tax=Pseudoalteromonas sp. DL2-H2.2 TaxID=2908889 RepID=UPI001F187615|nr:pre-peptidase C-terminal domain-containing protein [Pseudoalteromonas sp. DL2-H2.2]MCF2909220.1 pre-peptidase C-terminal domain-containing protein [Pseudoalteromonas sp. DL2-H2.2]